MLDDPKAGGGVRELEVSNGKIISNAPRCVRRLRVRRHDDHTAKLNLDSSGAYTWRGKPRINRTSHLRLRITAAGRHAGQSIWIIALQKQGGEPAGTIYIGANHGVLRAPKDFFSGGDRAAVVDVQTDKPDSEGADTDDDA